MKQRLITAFFGLILVFVVLFMFDTVALNVFIALICAIGVGEIFGAVESVKNKGLAIPSVIFAAAVPFGDYVKNDMFVPALMLIYLLYVVLVLILKHDEIKVEEAGFAFFATLLITMCVINLNFNAKILRAGWTVLFNAWPRRRLACRFGSIFYRCIFR